MKATWYVPSPVENSTEADPRAEAIIDRREPLLPLLLQAWMIAKVVWLIYYR